MKQKYIDLYMDWAHRAARLSHATRLNVGAVIVKDDTVISYGYNGMPAGWDNNCEHKEFAPAMDANEIDYPYIAVSDYDENAIIGRYRLKTNPEVLHAESNAIAKLARSHNSGLDAELFVTHSPCIECAKLIYQSGIKKVYFGTQYRANDGIEFLQKSKIEVIHVEENTNNGIAR